MPQCSDTVDNDGDGLIDYPDDPGCTDSNDESEDSAAMPQCMDGRDNDGDGKIDFPNDPGCIVPQADSEVDDCPSGAHCPECANGVDDDGNGMIDFPQDPGCSSAGDTDEFMHNAQACGTGMTIKPLPIINQDTGVLDATMSSSMLTTTCGGGNGAAAIAYEIHLSSPKVIVASTVGSTVDTVLDLRKAACQQDAAELVCNDNFQSADDTSKITKSLPQGNYYLIVEGKDVSVMGNYNLTVEFFNGEGGDCIDNTQCGPGLVCRIPLGGTTKKCEPHVCSDNVDDDGDGKLDFPTDPGCAGPDDDDETDDCPSGPTCPACANGVDDDADGNTDYPADTSCSSASGNSESCNGEQDPILPVAGPTYTDTMVGAHDDHNPSCGSDGGPDRLFTLKVPSMRTITIDTENSAFDTLLSLMSAACTEPSIQCDDDGGVTGNNSLITRQNLAAGTYIVAVDAYSSFTTLDTFNLNVAGIIAPGGACNPSDTLGGALQCPAGNPCEGTTGNLRCRPSICNDGLDNDGDGKVDFPIDPGCTDPDDGTEDDTCPGAGCPQCADGIDNDADGHIDYPADTSCTSASQNSESCITSEPIGVITTATTSGTTVGATSDFQPTCASSIGAAPDVVYQVRLPAMKNLNVNLNPVSYDSVHVLLNSTCGNPSIACSDPASMAVTTPLAAGTYFVVVDGWTTTSTGTFTINMSGTIAPGGACNPADTLNGALTCPAANPCVGATGSKICMASACNDGVDNDGDGKIDYPIDPGCTAPDDVTENDTCPGAGCPQCADGIDNDGDGQTDYPADTNCLSASGASEIVCNADHDAGGNITTPSVTGDLSTATNELTPSCQSNNGNDMTYALVLPVPVATLTLDTEGSTVSDTVLTVRNASCTGTALACDDDSGTGNLSLITLTNFAAGTYMVTVDGYSNFNNGVFHLNTHGVVAAGTACTSPLFASGVLTCATGTTCNGTVCQ